MIQFLANSTRAFETIDCRRLFLRHLLHRLTTLTFSVHVAILSQLLYAASLKAESSDHPNVVLILADDLGYSDLGSYGADRWQTPHLDRLAKEGIRFTNFLVSQPVCSASRASLLTGCYANRIGIHGALFPKETTGIHEQETTIAEMLRQRGYRTSMVGKWHLGDDVKFLPTRHGFDSYLGLPYSNDMWPHGSNAKPGTFPALCLLDGERVIDPDVDAVDQASLTARYRDRALSVIEEKSEKPFFLYFAHTFPHVPLFASETFRGSAKQGGIYGDVIQEFDAAIGAILSKLDELDLAKNTLILFSSDNGPWLTYGDHSGEAKGLREGKATVFEGGIRVPMIARWPGRIPAEAIQRQPAMTIDILPTLAKLVDADLPKTRIDGMDISPLLLAEPDAVCPHEAYYFYYGKNELRGVRSERWKLLLPQTMQVLEGGQPGSGGTPGTTRKLQFDEPILFDLVNDPGERLDVSDQHPDVMKRMMEYAERARSDLGDRLTDRPGIGCRAPGSIAPLPGQQQAKDSSQNRNISMKYLLYLPDNYQKDDKLAFPLMLFLHGGGESGKDLEQVKKHGPPKLIAQGRSFPMIVVSPQNPDTDQFWDTQSLRVLLDEIVQEYRVDIKRVYVTGMSRGGFGAWMLALQNPNRFAALVPICGATPSGYGKWLNKTPTWVFHGKQDPVIPVHESIQMVDELQKTNPNVKLTIYDDIAHEVWEKAYQEESLYAWLMNQSLE